MQNYIKNKKPYRRGRMPFLYCEQRWELGVLTTPREKKSSNLLIIIKKISPILSTFMEPLLQLPLLTLSL